VIKKSSQKRALIRCCSSCEYIYDIRLSYRNDCPVCGFASYGGRFIHGNKVYTYLKTQKPFYDKKMNRAASKAYKQAKHLDDKAKEMSRSYFMLKIGIT